jgi:hypothetical protein
MILTEIMTRTASVNYFQQLHRRHVFEFAPTNTYLSQYTKSLPTVISRHRLECPQRASPLQIRISTTHLSERLLQQHHPQFIPIRLRELGLRDAICD